MIENDPTKADPVSSDSTARPPDPSLTTAPSSGRAAFRDLKRQLNEADLKNPGAQKLILEMLYAAENERDDLKEYRSKFHESDKHCAVLEAKAQTNKCNEVLFGVGVGLGGTIVGLAPVFWSPTNEQGPIALTIGILLIGGSTLARVLYK